MKYKFYIYQLKVGGLKDRYDLDDYDLIREVSPLGKWSIKTSKDNSNPYVFRDELSGKFIFVGDDYLALRAIEDVRRTKALVIKYLCNGSYELLWKGWFSKYDWEVNEEECSLNFLPKVWDRYSPVFDILRTEYNIVECTSYDVRMDSWPYPLQRKNLNLNLMPALIPNPPIWHEYPNLPAGNKYYLVEETWLNDPQHPWIHVWRKYARERVVTEDGINPPAGTNWILDPQLTPPGHLGSGLYAWVRPFGNSLFTTYVSTVDGDYTYWHLDGIIGSFTDVIIFYRCRKLNDVLDFLLDKCDMIYQSQFFESDPHPMGGVTLKDTMLQQVSEVRVDEEGEGATIAMLKLEDLLNWIRDTFNCYWYVDVNGIFIIENAEYFESGLAYGGVPVIDIDFTAVTYDEYTVRMRSYKYDKPKLVRKETWKFDFTEYVDWLSNVIEYEYQAVVNDDTDERYPPWLTELATVYNQREDLPTSGWVLLDTVWDGVNYVVVKTTGAISDSDQFNGRFATANLLNEFWTWDRLLPIGYVNGIQTVFDSFKKLKVGKEFSIPLCCTEINKEGLFKTVLGNGTIDGADFDPKTGMIKIKLIYE